MAYKSPQHAWRNRAVYHITLTVTRRNPLLGTLNIPEQDVTKATVIRQPLGTRLFA